MPRLRRFPENLLSVATAGLLTCLNNEDCLGANRYCHRNRTMTSGECACKPGYTAARESAVKCLNIGE